MSCSNTSDDALSRNVYVRQRYMQSVQSDIKKFDDVIAEDFELAVGPSTHDRLFDMNYMIVAMERSNGSINGAPIEVLPWCRVVAIMLHDGVPLLRYRNVMFNKNALINDLLDDVMCYENNDMVKGRIEYEVVQM